MSNSWQDVSPDLIRSLREQYIIFTNPWEQEWLSITPEPYVENTALTAELHETLKEYKQKKAKKTLKPISFNKFIKNKYKFREI